MVLQAQSGIAERGGTTSWRGGGLSRGVNTHSSLGIRVPSLQYSIEQLVRYKVVVHSDYTFQPLYLGCDNQGLHADGLCMIQDCIGYNLINVIPGRRYVINKTQLEIIVASHEWTKTVCSPLCHSTLAWYFGENKHLGQVSDITSLANVTLP